MTGPRLAERLGEGDTVLLGWAASGSPAAVEAMAAAGHAAICIDQQHGVVDYREVVSSIAAAQACGAAPVIRPTQDTVADIGRFLDLGVEAVIAPMINSVEAARALVQATKYPPIGGRSWGPVRLQTAWGWDGSRVLAEANTAQLVFAMIETDEALSALDDILAVDGLDGIFVGPYDLSLSLSRGAGFDLTHGGRQDPLEDIARRTLAAGKIPAIFAGPLERALRCRTHGYRLIACGTDLGFVSAGTAETVAAFDGGGAR